MSPGFEYQGADRNLQTTIGNLARVPIVASSISGEIVQHDEMI
jgi:hypothetical protein